LFNVSSRNAFDDVLSQLEKEERGITVMYLGDSANDNRFCDCNYCSSNRAEVEDEDKYRKDNF
jgi:hypothetical protein